MGGIVRNFYSVCIVLLNGHLGFYDRESLGSQDKTYFSNRLSLIGMNVQLFLG